MVYKPSGGIRSGSSLEREGGREGGREGVAMP